MARSLNRVQLIGNVGNIETTITPNGATISKLSLAVDDSYKDRNSGQMVPKTEWVKVTMFGKLAEIAQQYVKKGTKLYLEGKYKTDKWQDQNGQDRYSTFVSVDNFSGQMIMLGGNDGQPPQAPVQQTPQQQSMATQAPANQQGATGPQPDDFSDDIPFNLYQRGSVV